MTYEEREMFPQMDDGTSADPTDLEEMQEAEAAAERLWDVIQEHVLARGLSRASAELVATVVAWGDADAALPDGRTVQITTVRQALAVGERIAQARNRHESLG